MAKNGKRIVKAYEGIDRMKSYAVKDAVKMVKGSAKAKFDETIELAMTSGVDTRHADQTVRGMVSLPSGTGKKIRDRGLRQGRSRAAGPGSGRRHRRRR